MNPLLSADPGAGASVLQRRSRFFTLSVITVLMSMSCGQGQFGTGPTPGPTPGPIVRSTVLLAAGDVGFCGSQGAVDTGEMLDSQEGTILAVGDLAYPHGSIQDYTNCYDPVWGRHKIRTKPAPGNHEYESAGAQPYFEYWGSAAGPAGLGYYSFRAGDWLVLSLNSNIPVGNTTAQALWIRQELTASTAKCQLAYFHHPLYSSGPNGDNARLAGLWQLLYDLGVDVIISAHEHLYERYAPMTPDGVRNDTRGIRQFIVGTGGASPYTIQRLHPLSEVQVTTYGLLKLTLTDIGYQWEFLRVGGGGRLDFGQDVCH